ncbi:MAG: Omp28-related outer membrane protein [Chitinophagales bacterium]|nr:Omp28-related outer membrane protein [Chitinophagales bacterium]
MCRIHGIIGVLISIFILSCQEIGPGINIENSNNNADSTEKKVLIENFTGVQCVNCPQGDTLIENLIQQYPGRVEVIDIHAGPLAEPVILSDPDLRTPYSDLLNTLIGPFPFQPAASIDRKLFEISPGDFERIISRNYWAPFVQQELDSVAQVSIDVVPHFDTISRLLTVTLNVKFLNEVPDNINASVSITESKVITSQLNQQQVIPDYIHNNVLRTMLTPYNGEIIDGTKTAGTIWSKQFSIILPDVWNADNCRLIAFVSKSAGVYDVLQVNGMLIK